MSKLPQAVSDYFRQLGKLGGAKGGIARAASLSPERRREIARQAVAARIARQAERKTLNPITKTYTT